LQVRGLCKSAERQQQVFQRRQHGSSPAETPSTALVADVIVGTGGTHLTSQESLN
jgi:hypothetical protein